MDRPDLYVQNLLDIKVGELATLGVSHLILDWDQFLYNKDGSLSRENVRALANWTTSGQIRGFVILSNAAFSSGAGREEKAKKIERLLAEKGLHAEAIFCLGIGDRKPKRVGFEKALAALRCDRRRVAVIGDQLGSDILGAQRMGLFNILVEPVGQYGWKSYASLRVLRNWITKKHLKLAPRKKRLHVA